MYKYRHNKLPESFNNFFCDINYADTRRSRDDYYNYYYPQPIRPQLSQFPNVQIIQNWNSLNILFKSIGNEKEFCQSLKQYILSGYGQEICNINDCHSCVENNN